MKSLKYISVIWVSLTISNLFASEIVHKFKSPSFSGIGTSAHYLTIENQEFSRKKAIQEDIEAALLQAQRDAERPYDHFPPSFTPRSLLCVRKQRIPFYLFCFP